jgi:hypothetical protein
VAPAPSPEGPPPFPVAAQLESGDWSRRAGTSASPGERRVEGARGPEDRAPHLPLAAPESGRHGSAEAETTTTGHDQSSSGWARPISLCCATCGGPARTELFAFKQQRPVQRTASEIREPTSLAHDDRMGCTGQAIKRPLCTYPGQAAGFSRSARRDDRPDERWKSWPAGPGRKPTLDASQLQPLRAPSYLGLV